ncbi:2-amino-4-hydroxy-6-hydroxymethyldihydropteridine pyrophosphokinase [Thiomicrorhabdus immobilis]|uniref:2-amino-4-hydroxy-6-hydroxymethyldihydropteridine pyrophosphokinase n=1 Tax=Thiomicrorhabdus immobilis TaxID=2791037 RepID=A0ABM7MC24_9GAMM|nr:2-amino-4-hydroxy-6-hydroxymethyldihydropteridine diphosphokinase [Thiomicrorhabdus immobilis]BCN92933.1 2-amino-4-hydroxy-6-hydroxymethyldihydropteridine pyrophosphokinase [Thiomicrorhabdus immobilis]
MTTKRVYIGLGSNLADPVEQLNIALESIASLPATQLIQTSSFYGSKPLGPQDQPDFINAVCEIQTELTPADLLKELQTIELEQGRIKKRHWGERLIDLDILLFGEEVIDTPDLIVPHSQITLRDFVLIPLAEIAPGLVIPQKGEISELISQLQESYLMTVN